MLNVNVAPRFTPRQTDLKANSQREGGLIQNTTKALVLFGLGGTMLLHGCGKEIEPASTRYIECVSSTGHNVKVPYYRSDEVSLAQKVCSQMKQEAETGGGIFKRPETNSSPTPSPSPSSTEGKIFLRPDSLK